MIDDGIEKRGILGKKELELFQRSIKGEIEGEIRNCRKENCEAIIASTELASSRLIKKKNIRRMILALKECNIGPILLILFRREPCEIIESRQKPYVGGMSFLIHLVQAQNKQIDFATNKNLSPDG